MGLMDLFTASDAPSGQKGTLEGQIKSWVSQLRSEQRAIDKEIRAIERQEQKVKAEIKQAIKGNRLNVVKILAKELVHSKKAKDRMYTTKANMNSISMQIQNQLGMAKVAQNIKASTDLMRTMNRLVNVSAVSAQMRAMSKEMVRAGIMEEVMDETFEALDEDVEEEAEEEVNKVIDEIITEIEQKADTSRLKRPVSAAKGEVAEEATASFEGRLREL